MQHTMQETYFTSCKLNFTKKHFGFKDEEISDLGKLAEAAHAEMVKYSGLLDEFMSKEL